MSVDIERLETMLVSIVSGEFREKRCHDCAFNRESQEMTDLREVYPSQMATVLEDLDYYLRGEIERMPLFICHQGMPTGPKGPPDYQPPRDGHGNPVGYPICAGFVQRFNEYIAQENAKADRVTTI